MFRFLHHIITHHTTSLTFLLVVPFLLSAHPHNQAPDPLPTPHTDKSTATGGTYYLPVVMRRFNTDLSIQGYEISQATQNLSNPIPLVEGRQSILRIYPKTNTVEPISGVSLAVSAYRGGQILPGSPISVGPGIVQLSPQREDIASSFNLRLPVEWLVGDIILKMTIDSSRVIWEKDEDNNDFTAALSFTSVPDLNVTLVPIDYIGANGDYAAPTSFNEVQNALLKFYPVKAVNITRHGNITAEGLESSDGWNDLLDTILVLKLSEGAPFSQVYYGYIPSQDSRGRTWFDYSEGVMGNGFVGQRAAIGLASYSIYGIDGGRIAAHEIGHNLGRLHAPCGTKKGLGSFPYPEAAIGQLGINVMDFAQISLIPANYKDLMSYCDPSWISDYTYRNLLEAQQQFGLLSLDQPVSQNLLIRVRFSDDGSIDLKPVYALHGYPSLTPPDGEYWLEFLDANGHVIDRQALPLLIPADTPSSEPMITAVVRQPTESYSSLRILFQEEPLLQRFLGSQIDNEALTSKIIPAGQDWMLRWGHPDIPALIRYTTDQGGTWTTLQMDWLGGELFLDSKSLPDGKIEFEIILSDSIDSIIHNEWENDPS